MADGDHRPGMRLAELVAALSLGIDLGFGQPMEHVLRQCLIAVHLAERAGLDEEGRATAYYTALLVNVGCHTDAHEQAKWFGDDIALKAAKYDHDLHGAGAVVAGLRRIGSGRPPLHRFRVGLEFALRGHREVDQMIAHHAAIARSLAEELGLPDAVCVALDAAYEQWDGRGWPGRLSGDAIPISARLAQLAEYVEVAHRLGGLEAARSLALERRGRQFDPTLADILASDANGLLARLDRADAWDAVIANEPALAITLGDDEVDAALVAIASFVDLKTPFMLGHARAVAELASGATRLLGHPEAVAMLRRAGLVHDFGRLGVSNAIWDKRAALGPGEWERVRLVPHLTARMLHRAQALAPLAPTVLQHRERLDGSGYPSGLSGAAISQPARILGAADAYQAMREPRPHRPALAPRAGCLRAARRSAVPDGSTSRSSKRCSPRRGTVSAAAARDRRGSPRGRSTCFACSPVASPTRRSPRSS